MIRPATALVLLSVALAACGGDSGQTKADAPATATPPKKAPQEKTPFQACEGGDREVCFALANLFERGAGVPRKPEAAVDFYGRACRLDQQVACTRLASYFVRGEVVKKDLAQAALLLSKACDKGEPRGCGDLAELYLAGVGLTKDPKDAADLLDKACSGKLPERCALRARMHRDGLGQDPDRARARVLYRRACHDGYAKACMRLAWLTADPCSGDAERACTLGKGDDSKTAELLASRCEDDGPLACVGHGLYLQHGRGVTRSWVGARDRFEKACREAQDEVAAGWACGNLANLHRKGEGIELSPTKAVGYYKQACAKGHVSSCRELGVFYVNQPDRTAEGVGLMRKACARNERVCRELKTLCTLGIKEACSDGQKPLPATSSAR